MIKVYSRVYSKGVQQGIQAKTQEIVLRVKESGVSVSTLAVLTGLTESEVRAIIEVE